MLIKIGIVDDNKSFNKLLKLLLQNLNLENISLAVHSYISPEEFLAAKHRFDIVIIDCLFKNSNLNGLKLAEEAKKQNSFTILTSAFAQNDFKDIIMSQNKFVDHFQNKDMDSEAILDKIKYFIKKVAERIHSQLRGVMIKMHDYKKKKELVPFTDINYAKSKDREKHLMLVHTSEKELTLSMTLNSFISLLNSGISEKSLNCEQEKYRADLYINRLNVEKIDEKRVLFKDGTVLNLILLKPV